MLHLGRDKLLEPISREVLKDRYMLSGEKSPQEAFWRAANKYSSDIDHAQRLYDYASKLWFMFSTPVLSNADTDRGLPISCFLNYVDDSRTGIMDHYRENAFLTSYGGGIGGYWGDIRPAGSKTSKGSESTGSIPFIKIVDSQMLAFSQGVTRRGSYAAYMHISHPEIEEFLDIRKPSGDINRKSLNLHNAVCIPDTFMLKIEEASKNPGYDDSWELIDPHTQQVVKTIPAKVLWIKILENRLSTGEPYIYFEDTVNDALPEYQKEKGLYVRHSNLCSEITLPSDNERTAVCCLSSVNLEEFYQWENEPQFIPDLIKMLNNVLDDFIERASAEEFHKAIYSASMERSIGLGAMGFHAFLQANGVAFESVTAKALNRKIFQHIKEQSVKASRELVEKYGNAEGCATAGQANAHLLAIAPNASSSIICAATSPSIEPYRANAYTQKTLSGSHLVKNQYLEIVLENYGMNTEEVWKDIILHEGSVQHLDFLTEQEKYTFKTAIEIDQRWLVDLAADRQEHICQSQSLNLFFPPDIHKGDLHDIHMMAWKRKVKTLYYLRSDTIKKADKIGEVAERQYINDEGEIEECIACEG